MDTYGKDLFDQGEYRLALKYFEKSFKIRVKKGDKELIDSTEYAVKICNERVNWEVE